MHEVVRIASDLIAIPSVNPMGSGASGELYSERNVALHLLELFRRWGVDAELSGNDPAHPNLVARVDRGFSETVVLEAHMDTVSHLEMDIDPFDPVVRDGKLYGRGSCDTKGSMSTYLAALSAVLKSNRPLRRNVIFAAVHDEEFSFGGIRELVATDALRGASFAIVGEPTSLRIIHAHKGICRFHVHTRGTAAHAAMPWLGDSAIFHMADVLRDLRQHADELRAHSHPDLGPGTFNVGRISGGLAVNIVPPHASIEVDRRLLPGESYTTVREQLQHALSAHADCVTIDPPFMESPGFYIAPDSLPCRALSEAMHSIGVEPVLETAYYGTDASFLNAAGIPTVVFGPGDIRLAHTRDEHIPVSDLEQATRMLIELIA